MSLLKVVQSLNRRLLSTTPKSFGSIPGPKPANGRGTVEHFVHRIQTLGFEKAVESYYKDYGPVVKQELPGGKEVWLFNPEHSLEAFRQEGHYPTNAASEAWPFSLIQSERAALGLASVGPEWARLRKAMQKDLFSPAVADSYLPLLDEPVRLISQQFPKVDRVDSITPLAAMDMFFSIMLGINLKTVLGINGNKENLVDPKDLDFCQSSIDYLSLGLQMMRDPTTSPQNPGPLLPRLAATHSKVYERIFYYFDRYVVGQVEKKIQEFEEKNVPLPYYYRLLARGEIKEEEARSELAGLLMAGVDTTHHVLLWTIFNLSRNPEKQEILRQEIFKVLGKDAGLESKHLKLLPYLNQVLRESHRITPPTPVTTFRRFPQDGEVGGYIIPKDTKITFALSAIQHDPQYVDNPDQFIPERWTPEAIAKRKGTPKEIIDHKLGSKPFGFGQRMCVGGRVAESEIKAVLTRLLRDWRMEWSPKQQEYENVFGTMMKASPFPKITFHPV